MVKVLNRDKIQRFFYLSGGASGSGGGSGSFDPSMLMGLVDLTSEQTITGQKTFASQILSTVATGIAPFSIASTTLVSNLNADLLDGVHASGLFTALAMDSNALSITIGGTTKTLTVGYATKAAQDDEGNTIKTTYLKKTDADTTYLKIAFFSRLFQAYNGNTAVNPNDLTTTIDNIKAMFGFWTDFYLSALGSGGASTPSFSLASLSDVDVTGVTNGQALVYNSTSAKWVPGTISSGVDMNVVWSALAAATNEQINASHLTTAAAGFFTSLTMSGNDLSITIGGTTKTLTVGYATSTSNLLTSDTAQNANDCYSTNAGLHYYRTNGNDMPNNNDGFILQWAYGGGYLVGQQLFLDDNATGVMKIRGKNVDGTFTNWWQIYTDKYHPNADYATSAGSASSADYATSAGSASSADYATSAGSASSADYATSSGSAGYAGYLSVYNKTIWGQTYWNSNGQPQNVTGNLYLGDYALYIGNGNYSYINAAYSNSQWAIGFKPGGTSIAEVNQSGFYCNGYVTALSDIRFKNVVERMDIDVKRIAEMSIIKFLWNDRDEDGKLHVGCVAQEWEGLLPWTIEEINGKKSLDYSVAALVSAVAIARKVEIHEERIARLERELAKERELMAKK